MNSQTPPPLPDANSAIRTYARAVALLIPTMGVWSFAVAFLFPKVEYIWQDAGLTGSKVQWLMNALYAFGQSFYLLIAGAIVFFLVVEFRWAAWPRYRRTLVACITLFIHTAVLIAITAMAVAISLAAPLLAIHRK